MKVGTDSVLLGAWALVNPGEHILDIGTGTGLLSLMLAQKVNGKCIIDAVEIEEGAIKDADTNISNSNWRESIKLHPIDFNVYKPKTLYDVIISNPPFFEGLAPANKTRSIARNASDKLSYTSMLARASALLKKIGRLYIIIPAEYAAKVIDTALDNQLYIKRQLNIKPKINKQVNRVLLELIKSDKSPTEIGDFDVQELVIRTHDNIYTNEHKLLTKDYYL